MARADYIKEPGKKVLHLDVEVYNVDVMEFPDIYQDLVFALQSRGKQCNIEVAFTDA